MTARDRSLTSAERRRARKAAATRGSLLSRRLGPIPVWAVAAGLLGLVAVVAIAAANTLTGNGDGAGSNLRYDVGEPGVGKRAPDFELASGTGAPFQLSAQGGKNVLLYFHEGLMCAPCWKQIEDIQADVAKFTALGIDEIAAISLDPVAAQQQRAQLKGIAIPVLADVDKAVSSQYDALSYGMMGGSMPGHTFILVGPDGTIRWRADYGGPPDYTMYVPDPTLLAELRRVLGGA